MSFKSMEAAQECAQALDGELAKSVIIPEMDRLMLGSAIANANAVLFEGNPGVGKTLTAKAAAKAIGGTFGRVQGTPDILPADITGSMVWNPEKREFEFYEGPIFANVFFADEFNRMMPKTQAAFMEAMQEGHVTAGRESHPLPDPFLVFATQNPKELREGTNPIPRANLDRFAIGIDMLDLNEEELVEVVDHGHETVQVLDVDDLLLMIEACKNIALPLAMKQRAARIIAKLREHEKINPTASVLGGARPILSVVSQARGLALLDKVGSVTAEHIDTAAQYALPHRTDLTYEALDDKMTAYDIVEELVSTQR